MALSPTRNTSFASNGSTSPIKMTTTKWRDLMECLTKNEHDGIGPGQIHHSLQRPIPQRAAIPPLREPAASMVSGAQPRSV
jgi:hypothetical protein